MSDANLTLVLTAAGLIGCGVYLLLERSLSRVLLGIVMMSNGVSLAFLVAGGPAGEAPVVNGTDTATMADPLPQAMVLTAIVITLATVASGSSTGTTTSRTTWRTPPSAGSPLRT
jgi:multicomponent Na+:H+ antiporter subunit C